MGAYKIFTILALIPLLAVFAPCLPKATADGELKTQAAG
jgi:hypothetical protein